MIKVVLNDIQNVGDLIDALSKLPKDTQITPFGSPNTVLAYDADNKVAYLDEANFIEEMKADLEDPSVEEGWDR